jgi:hypothetical protein
MNNKKSFRLRAFALVLVFAFILVLALALCANFALAYSSNVNLGNFPEGTEFKVKMIYANDYGYVFYDGFNLASLYNQCAVNNNSQIKAPFDSCPSICIPAETNRDEYCTIHSKNWDIEPSLGSHTIKISVLDYHGSGCAIVAEVQAKKPNENSFTTIGTFYGDNYEGNAGYVALSQCRAHSNNYAGFTMNDLDSKTFTINIYAPVIIIDNDNDGYNSSVDCNDNNSNVWRILRGYIDSDRDSYGSGSLVNVCSGNSLPSGYNSRNGDCNNNNANIHPGALEICNNIDDDCDGMIDEGNVCNNQTNQTHGLNASTILSFKVPKFWNETLGLWTINSSTEINLNCIGQCARTFYNYNGSWVSSNSYPISFYFRNMADGIYTVLFYSRDIYGNNEAAKSYRFIVENDFFQNTTLPYCGDGICNDGENHSWCPFDCDENESASCNPDWQCSSWSSCKSGKKTRICVDNNYCYNMTGKPDEEKKCKTCQDDEDEIEDNKNNDVTDTSSQLRRISGDSLPLNNYTIDLTPAKEAGFSWFYWMIIAVLVMLILVVLIYILKVA